MTPHPHCWLNGTFQPLAQARVSPLDRAFLFADAVYEVIPVHGGRLFRLREHLDRLRNSLEGIGMASPLSHPQWLEVLDELVERNGRGDQYTYVQVSRGTEFGRNHAWPDDLAPTLFAYCSPLPPTAPAMIEQGVAAITAQDIRWARCDIKSTSLLPNVLLKKQAARAGAFETILLRDQWLTEGASTSVHVLIDDTVLAPPNSQRILPGTTRTVVEELAQRIGLPTRSEPISETRLRGAREIWLSFSTRGLLPVTRLDGRPVGDGRPGEQFRRMHAAFDALIEELAGTPAL
ncbi:MAG: D-amino acid aminotransferase [Proteobacteria bacterium]|nr:D-amino acid aminotransferase [Pseudomonadota bacterium]